MNTTITAILLSSALALAFITDAQSEVVFRDDFNGTVDSAWNVKRQDLAFCAVSTNGLSLRCNAGDNWESGTNYKNLFLITNPASQEFIYTAKARWVTLPTVNWAQFALVAYDDDDNYVRVDHQYGNGNKHIEFLVEVSGKQLPDFGWEVKGFGTNQFWLQMRHKGTNYSSWYRPPNKVTAHG